MPPATFRQACRHWELLIKWHALYQGAWKRQAVLGYITFWFPDAVLGTDCKQNVCRDVQAVLHEQETRRDSFTEDLGRAALCRDDGWVALTSCVWFFVILFFFFCFSVSFGSHGLASHFQNRHLIKLVTVLNYFAWIVIDEERRKQKELI